MTSAELGVDLRAESAVLPMSYIVGIVDLITQQSAHKTQGRTDPEARASFQYDINMLADQALPILRTANPTQIEEIQDYLGKQDPQVGIRVSIEIEKARLRTTRQRAPRRRTLPRPRSQSTNMI